MSTPFFLILIVSIVVVMMTAGGKRNKCEQPWSRRFRILAISLPLFVGLVVLVWFLSRASHEPVPAAFRPVDSAPAELAHVRDVAEPVVTNEQLWDRLTESRINLDDEQEDASPAESEPKGRPDWVDEPPKRVGDVHRAVVASDPFTTVDECFEQLEHLFPVEVERRLAKLVPRDQHSHVESASLEASGITLDYIMREICREQFTETTEHDFGAMKKVYVLMEFTPAIESHLLDSWQIYLRRYRLTAVAQIAGCVLATLAVLYGLLQIDTWTRGYYTRWLRWGVPAAILALVAMRSIGITILSR